MLTAVASHVKLEKERSQPKPELAIVLYGMIGGDSEAPGGHPEGAQRHARRAAESGG